MEFWGKANAADRAGEENVISQTLNSQMEEHGSIKRGEKTEGYLPSERLVEQTSFWRARRMGQADEESGENKRRFERFEVVTSMKAVIDEPSPHRPLIMA